MNKPRKKLRFEDRDLIWAMVWRCGYDLSEFSMQTSAAREAEVLLRVKQKGVLTERWLEENQQRRKAARKLEQDGAIIEIGKVANAAAFKYQIQETRI